MRGTQITKGRRYVVRSHGRPPVYLRAAEERAAVSELLHLSAGGEGYFTLSLAGSAEVLAYAREGRGGRPGVP